MIKAIDNGKYSCISKNGNPKSRWDTSEEVIAKAKYLNEKNHEKNTKLVGYKCPNCHKYHLTTVKLNKCRQ